MLPIPFGNCIKTDKAKKILLSLLCIIAYNTQAIAAPQLSEITHYDKQWTGIAIAKDNRIFVNFPTWNDYPAQFKVAEIVNGQLQAYPSEKLNQDFICVQSVVADDKNTLWILDPAKLKGQGVAASGARLYEIDLGSNMPKRIYIFPSHVALADSYLNDIRIDTKKNFAYLTDSGHGGIIALNLSTGESWRALSDIPEVLTNLESIDFHSTGTFTRLSHSDGLELSADKKQLYFTALGGNILYKISTDVLRNPQLSITERAKHIKIENKDNVPTDGLILRNNKLYMANLPEESIWEYDLKRKTGKNITLDKTIRWADSFALDNNNNIFFTTSQINYEKDKRTTYKIYKLEL